MIPEVLCIALENNSLCVLWLLPKAVEKNFYAVKEFSAFCQSSSAEPGVLFAMRSQ